MSQSDRILELAQHQRVLRAADVREHGWSPQLLIRLHQAGKLQRFARGLYGLPDAEATEHAVTPDPCRRKLRKFPATSPKNLRTATRQLEPVEGRKRSLYTFARRK